MNEPLHPFRPILIVDDEEAVLFSFDTELRENGYNHIVPFSDSREVMERLEATPASIVLLDLWMPHVSGEDLLQRILTEHPETPVIIVTGIDDVETAVRCMKSGAFDYLVKPLESGLLTASVSRALSFRALGEEVNSLKSRLFSDDLRHPEAFDEIVTQNEDMIAVFKYLEVVGPSQHPVLITGETGVGKELAARAIHKLSGRSGPFTPVNIAGLDDNVFSDTLFGHTKGAFTGADRARGGLVEKAAGGTLFLDEIGDLSLASQVKLLRMIQEREYLPLGEDQPRRVEARIVAATNQNIGRLMTAGRFRRDLYYRLRMHQVSIPSLQDRIDDLPLLVDHFLEQAGSELGKKKPAVPCELYTLLGCHPFPGNVRELKAMVYEALSQHQSRMLSLEVFRKYILCSPSEIGEEGVGDRDDDPCLFTGRAKLPTLNEAAALLVAEALRRSKGNITQAAAMLGVTRQALSKRLRNVRGPEDEEPNGRNFVH